MKIESEPLSARVPEKPRRPFCPTLLSSRGRKPVAIHWTSVSEPDIPLHADRDTMDCRVVTPFSPRNDKSVHPTLVTKSRAGGLTHGGSVHRFKAFEFGMSQIKMAPVTGTGMSFAKSFGFCPGNEVIF